MRNAGRLARSVLDLACDATRNAAASSTTTTTTTTTTDDINDMVHHAILDSGAYPSPLNYRGFPKSLCSSLSLCSSVNEVVCHGIPDSRPLRYRDVVSFDVSCYLDGVHGEHCAAVIVGDLHEDDDDEEGEEEHDDDNNNNAGVGGAGNQQQHRRWESEEERQHIQSARRLVHATKLALQIAVKVCGRPVLVCPTWAMPYKMSPMNTDMTVRRNIVVMALDEHFMHPPL